MFLKPKQCISIIIYYLVYKNENQQTIKWND